MKFHLQKYSYRFAEQVLNSNLSIKQEVERIISDLIFDVSILSRPKFNSLLREQFIAHGWEDQPHVFGDSGDPGAKMDFLKSRVGVEVGFGHASFIGIDLLKFQVSSYAGLDKIDVGIYIVTTREFQSKMKREHENNWEGSLTFEKVVKYLPHFKSAIQVPIYVIGIGI
jgi:Restriction endonuclease BglII